MAIDPTDVIFFSDITYDKVRKSGTATVSIGGGTWQTLINFSDLGLTVSPKVYVLMKPTTVSTWRLPGGGIYFTGGGVPIIRVTNTTIQAMKFLSAVNYNVKYWILDTPMKAN